MRYTMHLQQTKRGSRETGGPQYYFHSLTKQIKRHLRAEKSVPVALVSDKCSRAALLLAWSATLGKLNKTFLSA